MRRTDWRTRLALVFVCVAFASCAEMLLNLVRVMPPPRECCCERAVPGSYLFGGSYQTVDVRRDGGCAPRSHRRR